MVLEYTEGQFLTVFDVPYSSVLRALSGRPPAGKKAKLYMPIRGPVKATQLHGAVVMVRGTMFLCSVYTHAHTLTLELV